jgi:hypothetical protein
MEKYVSQNSVFQNLIVADLHEMSLVALGSFILFSFAKIDSFILSCVPQYAAVVGVS